MSDTENTTPSRGRKAVAIAGGTFAVLAVLAIFATNDIVGAATKSASPSPSPSRIVTTAKPLDVATAKPTETAKPTPTPTATVTPSDLPTEQPQAQADEPLAETAKVATPAKPYVPCSAVGLVADVNGVCHEPAKPQTVTQPQAPKAVSAVPCEEDQPCWDCKVMGNGICGPTTTPTVQAPTCNAPAGWALKAMQLWKDAYGNRAMDPSYIHIECNGTQEAGYIKIADPSNPGIWYTYMNYAV